MAMEGQSDLHVLQDLFDEDPEFEAVFDLLGDGNNRFEQYTDEDVLKFIGNQENTNTKKNTTADLRLLKRFLQQNGELRQPEHIPPEELSSYVSRFILAVRKKDGSEYEPSSLRGFISSIDRYLRQNGYAVSMLKDQHFFTCREALKSKQKQLKSEGKGNKPRAAAELTDEYIDSLYRNGQLGMHSPPALINTLWLINSLHFGMRGGLEQRNLKWGDVQVESDTDGRQYLIYTQERQTKTRNGENPRDIRKVKPRAYATPDNPDRDPVATYMEYSNRRPEGMNNPDDAFFLSINTPNPQPGQQWFKCQNMGINKIYSIVKNMTSEISSSNKHLTNHSARKHLVQKLNDSNIPPNHIIQISGHRNVNSVNNYSTINTDQQASISKILSNTNQSVKPVSFPISAPLDNGDMQELQNSQPCTGTNMTSKQYSHANTSALFQGSTFHNSVINVYCQPDQPFRSNPGLQDEHGPPPAKKYRRILPLPGCESDSDY